MSLRDARVGRAACLFAVLSVFLTSCGSDSTSEPSTRPLPVLITATPPSLVVGAATTTLTLTGSGFIPSSQTRWNGADRITQYLDDRTLRMELLTSDVASIATGTVTVVNGAPGGGTSGIVQVPVGYPTPRVTSVTPNAVPIQSISGSVVPITIVGSGFVTQSSIRVGSAFATIVSVTPTQISANVSSFYLSNPGTLTLTVVNPAPGGGPSNGVDFSVLYPVPAVTSVSPDSTFTGAAFTLTVNGTGFGSSTVVNWNGADRPTTYVSATRVTAAIAATDVATAGSTNITVVNPAPGGGASNAVAYPVRERAASIVGVAPGTITAGSGPVLVTVTGTNFRSGATAQWDGQTRSATIAGTTSLTLTLNASDVSTPRVGKITVTNPGASGASNSIAVAVLPTGPTLSVARAIAITQADIAYDETRGLIYASVPGSAPQFANSVVAIDPASGAVTKSVAVGSNPAPLAITEDGQYLYVGLAGAPRVVRVALSTFTVDLNINFAVDGFFGSTFAEAIVPIPGSPRTFAASTYYTGTSPRNAGTVVYDNDVPRVAKGPGHTGSNRITRGPAAARIYGYNNETTEFGFRSVLVSSDGLHEETVKPGLVSGFGADIAYSGGFVYATTGEVVDVAAMQKVGTIPAGGIVRPDATNARVHFLNGTTIKTFHYLDFTSIGTFADSSLANHTRLLRWGTDGLAAGGGATLVLLRGTLTAP